MRQDGYFDRVLVKKETENGQWVLYQISTIRPHLNGISDRILCASCGLDALMILNDAKIGAELELKGCETNIRFTDLDFTQKDTTVFVCEIVDMKPPANVSSEKVKAALKELLLDYYNKTE